MSECTLPFAATLLPSVKCIPDPDKSMRSTTLAFNVATFNYFYHWCTFEHYIVVPGFCLNISKDIFMWLYYIMDMNDDWKNTYAQYKVTMCSIIMSVEYDVYLYLRDFVASKDWNSIFYMESLIFSFTVDIIICCNYVNVHNLFYLTYA